mgnify:CR=1 FL=1
MKRMILAGSVAFALAACDGATAEKAEADETLAATEDEAADSEDAAAETDDAEAESAGDAAEDDSADEAEDAAPAPQRVACGRGEANLFSCTAGNKRIAVCGVTNAQGQRTAQYRFGSGNGAEITLDGGRFANVAYSGGGESQIEFANGATRYIVYSRTVRTNFDERGNMPEFTDGVVVVSNGRRIANRECTGNVESVDVMSGDSYGGVASELFFEDY